MKTKALVALALVVAFISLPFMAKADEVVDKYKVEREKGREYLVSLGATKDEAVKIIPRDEDCATCHLDQFKEWAEDAPHYQAISFARGAYNHFVRDMRANGLKTDKKVMSTCDRCHAPTLQRYASEKLYEAITNIIGEDTDDKKLKANEKVTALKHIGVGCTECHISQWSGKPDGPAHGPIGEANSPHATKYAPEMAKAEFCSRCHGQDPKDADAIKGAKVGKTNLIYCGLNYDDWKMAGSTQQCQDCHMEKVDGGARHSHKFPGANSAEFLKKAVDLEISGKLTMAENAYINIDVISKAGHVIPEGCILLADVVMNVTVKEVSGKNVPSAGKVLFETQRTWYAQSNGFIPLAFDPNMKEVPRTPAVWAVNDYNRSTSLQPGKNNVLVNFRVPSGTTKLYVEVEVGYKQKGKTLPMKSLSKVVYF
ncbi:MAG: hypothetical protein HGA78_07035 [Nitrospirales bacterium]|nr:hypothetical protein [Nitrospirales bacterium]